MMIGAARKCGRTTSPSPSMSGERVFVYLFNVFGKADEPRANTGAIEAKTMVAVFQDAKPRL